MPSDEKVVHQETIKFKRQGEGPFSTIRGWQVPEPPADCESQQLFDWATTISLMNTKITDGVKMRLVEAYAGRWHIPTEDVAKFEGE